MLAKDCPICARAHYLRNFYPEKMFGMPPNCNFTEHTGILRTQNSFREVKILNHFNKHVI